MKKLFSSIMLMALALSTLTVQGAGANNRATAAATLSFNGRAVAPLRFARRQITESNRRLRYTIKARYPQAIGQTSARTARLNEEIRALVISEINGFKKDFTKPQGRMGPSGSDFDVNYTVTYAANDLVSIAFGISAYYEGAAHPLHASLAFNYDLKGGKRLSLSDLFKSNSNYLQLISDYSIKALKKELGAGADSDWIQTGAGPKEENYKSWNLTPKGLQVTFDPYQVASYAEGEHVVVVPYNLLKNVSDTDGPLSRVISR